MFKKAISVFVASIFCLSLSAAPPLEWIDSVTHHKIVRLTRTGTENYGFYFHNNPFIKSVDGKSDMMLYSGTVDGQRQLFSVDLKTFETKSLNNDDMQINKTDVQIRQGNELLNSQIIDIKHREIIYQQGDSIFATHIDTHKTRLIYVLPSELVASVYTVNADGTLLAGRYNYGEEDKILQQYPNDKGTWMAKVHAAHIKNYLFVIDLKTKKMKVIHEENDWTWHIQFSPTDPDLLMFCHEGPWQLVDRIWTINVKKNKARLMHKRTMDMEIAGHEFFSPDGKTIWFDLQQPMSETFFLCGADVATGKEVKYQMTNDEWSIHFAATRDKKLFCGDGSDPTQVAHAKDGQWIYLYTTQGDKLVSEKLVNMKDHNYKLEPNVHFSPDNKWVIFQSNMFGEAHLYAVEIAKTNYFDSFPQGSTPKEIGQKLGQHFIPTSYKQTGFQTVVYPEVCTWLGALRFARITGNQQLYDQLKNRFETLITSDKEYMPPMNHVDFNMFGCLPFELYQVTKEQKYLDLGLQYADTQWLLPENASGEENDWAGKGLTWQTRLWIDDMYMITIVQAYAYQITGDRKYIDRAAREMVVYLDELQRPNGLFYHAPDVPFFWGRGNGWMAAGMTELLRLLPEDNLDRSRIMKGYLTMMKSLKQYQTASGMWNQLVDDPACWAETSCSGMFAYAMITGVKKGWLDATKYAPIAEKAWLALVSYINNDGDVTDICVGTNKENDRQYYYDRPRKTGDFHGQAPVLWCAVALLE